jgi:hypothetical protein
MSCAGLRLTCFLLVVACGCIVGGCATSPGHPAQAAPLPSGVGLIGITSIEGVEPPIVSVTVTASRKVREIMGWIAQMKPVPTGPYSCPENAGAEPTVSLTFRTSATGQVLATASEIDDGWGSGPCNPLDLTVSGRGRRALVAGMFLERVERLLKIDLGFGHGMLVATISTPRGRPLSPATLTRLRAATRSGYYVYVAVDPKVIPSYATGPFLGLPIGRSGEVSTVLGPGIYLLDWQKYGQAAACPPTRVSVRVDRTTRVTIPVGCATK